VSSPECELTTAFALLALLLLGIMSCTPHSASTEPAESHMAKLTIQDVVKKNTDHLMSIPGVVGVAVGECGGHPCVLILVVEKTSEIMAKLPSELEGFPVAVEETGTIHRLGAKAAIHQR
jgi:hypothetical protein